MKQQEHSILKKARILTQAQADKILLINGDWKPNMSDICQYKYYPYLNPSIEIPENFVFMTPQLAQQASKMVS